MTSRSPRAAGPWVLTVGVLLFSIGEFGSWVAVTIRAEELGGVGEAALVLIAQLLPAAVLAAAMGGWLHHFRPGSALIVTLCLFAASQSGLAVLITKQGEIGRWGLYVVAVLATLATVAVRPALGQLLTDLVPDGRERVRRQTWFAAMAALGMLLGPAAMAVALDQGVPQAALACFGAAALVAALLAAQVPKGSRDLGGRSDPDPSPQKAGWWRQPGLVAVLVLVGAESLLSGAADLLVVALPAATGPAEAAWFSAAFGGGAVLGGVVAVMVAGSRSPSGWAMAATVVAAAATVGFTLTDGLQVTAVLFLLLGAMLSVVSGAGRGVLQLLTPARLATRVYSTAESLDLALLLVGVAAVPLVIAALGVPGLCLVLGGVAVAVVLLVGRTLRGAEGAAQRFAEKLVAVQRMTEYSGWPTAALEELAEATTRRVAVAGDIMVTAGDLTTVQLVVLKGGGQLLEGTEQWTVSAGEVVGQIGDFMDLPARQTLEVSQPSEFLEIPAAAVRRLRARPGFLRWSELAHDRPPVPGRRRWW